MHYLIVDCETNGFLDVLDKIHSLVIKNEEGTVFSCHDHGAYRTVEDGLRLIMNGVKNGALVVLHNGIKFDIPAIQKLYPWFDIPVNQVRDTLVLARLLWADISDSDLGRVRKGFPKKLIGSHSLKAWGYRLGVLKGDFGETTDWSEWTPEMQAYCEQDVEVTERLWKAILKKEPPIRAVELETWFAHIIAMQERFGYPFDVQKGQELYLKLLTRRVELDAELKAFFGGWYVNQGVFTPKVNNGPSGYTKGVGFSKVKWVEFNPGSRQHIANRLTALYGWEPKEFTDGGQPKIDEDVLKPLTYPPCKLLLERFLVDKRISQLAEGDAAWLKLEKQGRIHGSVNTIGAVTGRCTHSHPNIAQVPAVDKVFGTECRELFHAPEGWVQIGADASGLELRCLAHFMARWDGGAYGKIILEGDIHTVNQQAAGLPTRNNAKTFIYAFLYGAGDEKIGSIIGKGAAAGKKLKQSFLNKTPALKRLKEAVAQKVKTQGYLLGIDGRKLSVRSAHSALNTLLQSAGALLVKQATVNLYLELSARGYVFGKDWAMVAHVHDEYQLHVRPHLVEEVKQVAVWSFQEAGRQFNWRCPLDGEAKVGRNWAECH